jgi:hypothetical protein
MKSRKISDKNLKKSRRHVSHKKSRRHVSRKRSRRHVSHKRSGKRISRKRTLDGMHYIKSGAYIYPSFPIINGIFEYTWSYFTNKLLKKNQNKVLKNIGLLTCIFASFIVTSDLILSIDSIYTYGESLPEHASTFKTNALKIASRNTAVLFKEQFIGKMTEDIKNDDSILSYILRTISEGTESSVSYIEPLKQIATTLLTNEKIVIIETEYSKNISLAMSQIKNINTPNKAFIIQDLSREYNSSLISMPTRELTFIGNGLNMFAKLFGHDFKNLTSLSPTSCIEFLDVYVDYVVDKLKKTDSPDIQIFKNNLNAETEKFCNNTYIDYKTQESNVKMLSKHALTNILQTLAICILLFFLQIFFTDSNISSPFINSYLVEHVSPPSPSPPSPQPPSPPSPRPSPRRPRGGSPRR